MRDQRSDVTHQHPRSRWRLLVVAISVLASLVALSGPVFASGPAESWTLRTPSDTWAWTSVTYGDGRFVAVAPGDTDNTVMTSPDGTTWTARAAPAGNWTSVTYGNELFVAVSDNGHDNRVMTSPNGITWTLRAAATADTSWTSVTYGNGIFVAISQIGTNRVMTSPNGITWTAQTAAATSNWLSVTYGNGLFVAVADGGADRVMTSPNGITWTAQTAAAANSWRSVTYGNGLLVAVARSGAGNRVMTSPDGITWTTRASAADSDWRSVTYGNGLYVAVACCGNGNLVMTSPDGSTWTLTTAPVSNWQSVTYGNERFVAVSHSGDQVMTSSALLTPAFSASTSTADGFTVDVTNYHASYTWTPSPESGAATFGTPSGSARPLTVTGLASGATTTVTVSVTRNGFTYGTVTVTGSAQVAQVIPVAPVIPDPAMTTQPVNTTPTNTTVAPPPTTAPPAIEPEPNDPNPGTAPTLQIILALPEATLLSSNTLSPGDPITVTVGGFTPNEPVLLVIASNPRVLATVQADGLGVANLTGLAPSDIAPGNHTLAVIAPISGTGFRQTVLVTSQQLPQTGTDPALLVAFVLLLAGVGLLTARRHQHPAR